MRKKVAIIGGGIGGLTAAYKLHPMHEITLFEKENRLGGNAFSHRTKDGYQVDIAVAAFGKAGYPNFFALLDELKVERGRSLNSCVSFYNLDSQKGIYVTPFSLKGLVAQNFAMFKPQNLAAFYRLTKALDEAKEMLHKGELKDKTMFEAFGEKPWFSGDVKAFFMSALCLLSSMQANEILAAPAEFFIRKLEHHNDLISAKSFYSITAIKNGTQSYVNALADKFRDRIYQKSAVKEVCRENGKVFVIDGTGVKHEFDCVVMATPADESLRLLKNPTEKEKKIMGKWKYKKGKVVVHKDTAKFPPRNLIQAYTFLYTDNEKGFDTSVSGALWHEPGVDENCPYVSTQHPNFAIDPNKIDFETSLLTPIYDKSSVQTIDKLPSLNGTLNTYYCGSYFGFGLHEDAVVSAMNAAKLINEQTV